MKATSGSIRTPTVVRETGATLADVSHLVRRVAARPLVLAPLLVALALSGCGGGEDEADGPVASPSTVDLTPSAKVELARGIYEENDPGGEREPLVSADESRCVSDALLARFDVEGLIAIGVLDNKAVYRSAPSGLATDEAGQWVDAFEECLDIADYALGVTREGVRAIAPKYGKDDAAWGEARACIDDAAPARAVLLESLVGKPSKGAARAEFLECVKLAYPGASA